MEHSIGVGIIVGIVFTIGFMVYKTDKFTANQKYLILPLLLFLPLGVLILISVSIYNRIKLSNDESIHTQSKSINNSTFIKSSREIDAGLIKTNEDRTKSTIQEKISEITKKSNLLHDAYTKGFFSPKEYLAKKKILDFEKSKLTKELSDKRENDLIISENISSFEKLHELEQVGLISKEEYNLKVQLLILAYRNKKNESQESETETSDQLNNGNKSITVSSSEYDESKSQPEEVVALESESIKTNVPRKWVAYAIVLILLVILMLFYRFKQNPQATSNFTAMPKSEVSSYNDVSKIPLFDLNQKVIVSDSAYIYLNNDGEQFYRVQNSILFWTFDNNRSWVAKKQMTLYEEPYSNTILDKIKPKDQIFGLDVEFHYYKNSMAVVSKVHKAFYDNCPDGSVKSGDTILLLNAEGECYWNVINNSKFTGVHFSDEEAKLTKSIYDGCNMIEGKRISFDEYYIVWVKIQSPSRKIGWLKFTSIKGNQFFDFVRVEDEGVFYD